jgi:hypothetical protein
MSLLHFLCHLTVALVGIFEIYMLWQNNWTLLQNSIVVHVHAVDIYYRLYYITVVRQYSKYIHLFYLNITYTMPKKHLYTRALALNHLKGFFFN